ncbi:MAG TPA: protein kinase [Polyangiaceae bacterium]
MQASAKNDAASAHGRTFERIAEVRKLAGRKVPTAIVHAFGPGGAEVAVLERYAAATGAEALDRLEKDARIAMSLRHPNLAAVRDVWRENGELCIASEWVEGETLEELRKLAAGGKELTIEVGVRVIVDLLGALSALHTLGAGALAHGDVTPLTAIVGFDGATRLVRPYRGHVAAKLADGDWFSYAAPEVCKGGPADSRADLYSVGVILWETLSRRKLFPKATREGRAARTLPVGKPTAPVDAAWAAPLATVAERALANDPAARYTSAAEMAAAVRLAVRSKLAMPPRVAAAVDKLAGDKILSRRMANALPEVDTSARVSGRPSRPSLPPQAIAALSKIRPSSRPPGSPDPKAKAAMPPVPKAPPLPAIEPPPPPAPTLERPHTGPRPFAPALDLSPPPPRAAHDSISDEDRDGPTKVRTVPPEVLAELMGKPAKPPPPAPKAEAISLDDALLEAVPSAPAPTPPPAVTPALTPAGVPPKSRSRALVIAVAVLVSLIALAAIVAVGGSSSKPTDHATKKTTATTPSTATATATATATPMATVTATATATATPTAMPTATPEDSSTGEPSPTQAAPAESHHPHARPRPTYDPMGI